MFDDTYTPALDRSDVVALRDLLRPAPLDELEYIARRDAFDDLRRCMDAGYRRRSGSLEGRRTE